MLQFCNERKSLDLEVEDKYAWIKYFVNVYYSLVVDIR